VFQVGSLFCVYWCWEFRKTVHSLSKRRQPKLYWNKLDEKRGRQACGQERHTNFSKCCMCVCMWREKVDQFLGKCVINSLFHSLDALCVRCSCSALVSRSKKALDWDENQHRTNSLCSIRVSTRTSELCVCMCVHVGNMHTIEKDWERRAMKPQTSSKVAKRESLTLKSWRIHTKPVLWFNWWTARQKANGSAHALL